MSLFRKKIPELDQIIQSIKMNMENNYKDNAQEGYHRLSEVYSQYARDGKLSDKQKAYYEPILIELAKELEGFTHREQKAFWYLEQ